MRFLFIYPAASLAETIIAPIIHSKYPKLSEIGLPNMLINSFLLIEFFVIYHYFLQIFRQSKVRILLYVIVLTYAPSVVFIWWITNAFNKNPEVFFLPQAICILGPGLYYFFDIVKSPLKTELRSEPSFWIMIGLMLYFGCTLPLFMLDSILEFSNLLEKNIYSINSLCYGLLFLLMIKAFLCKKREAQ
jgi:hypothetical protein